MTPKKETASDAASYEVTITRVGFTAFDAIFGAAWRWEVRGPGCYSRAFAGTDARAERQARKMVARYEKAKALSSARTFEVSA